MMTDRSANKFILALVKNLQAVCHGHVEFDKNVKVVGHLYLTVDNCNSEFNYIVNEKVSKSDESSTTFISKSFYAIDPQQTTPKKNVDRPFPSPTPHVLGKTRYDINVDLTDDPSQGIRRGGQYPQSHSYRLGYQQSRQNHKQSVTKRRSQVQRSNQSGKVQKLSSVESVPFRSSSPIDLDSDLAVTFATAENSMTDSNIDQKPDCVQLVESSISGETHTEKYDFEVFKTPDFEESETETSEKIGSSSTAVNDPPVENPPISPPNLSLEKENPTIEIDNVDISRVKEEMVENLESGDSFFNSSVHSHDSLTGESKDDEFFASLREQTAGLYPVGLQSNVSDQIFPDIPNLPGVSGQNQGAAYLPVAGTSSDGSNNTGTIMDISESNWSTSAPKTKICCECGIEVMVNNFRQHLITHKSRAILQCHMCFAYLKDVSSLKEHMKYHLPDETHLYDYCTQTYQQKSTLREHIQTVHEKTDDTYRCGSCDKVFTRISHLEIHMKTHLNRKLYDCTKCGKNFSSINNLERHIKDCNGVKIKIHQCKQCKRLFGTNSTLRDHVASEHEHKIFACICGNNFKWRPNLHRHQRKCPIFNQNKDKF